MMNDPICAIATPYGVGAISIIRCSGNGSIDLVSKLAKKDLNKYQSNTIHHAYIYDGDKMLDEVMISIFKGKKNFTGEESLEINCHGGVYNTNKVLECLLKNGFKMALPGEFSKRAFLNGRIDLTEAEGIMDLISSTNDIALSSSINSLRKSIYNLVTSLREDMLKIIANIEVNIDYPEYDDVIMLEDDIILPELKKLITKIEHILNKSKISVPAIQGIKTAIVGKPNVGKSSLLNALLEEDKAIVSNIPGTTRDIVEGKLSLGNITLDLIDTAGIRKSDDYVENIGIERSKKAINDADLVLLVFDSSKSLSKEDLELKELTKDKKRIIIYNKSDLDNKIELNDDEVLVSSVTRDGFDELEKKISEIMRLNEFNASDPNYLSNARQVSLMNEALKSLNDAYNSCKDNEAIDMVEISLKESYTFLGEIIGDSSSDSLIKELFSKFCLGK